MNRGLCSWMSAIVVSVAVSMLAVANENQTQPQQPKEEEAIVGVNNAIVPSGFDADSEMSVVVSGLFSDSCYRWKRAEVTHNNTTNIHEVRVVAGVNRQGYCLQALVMFTQPVNVGKLSVGEHKIRFVNAHGNYLEKTVVVE